MADNRTALQKACDTETDKMLARTAELLVGSRDTGITAVLDNVIRLSFAEGVHGALLLLQSGYSIVHTLDMLSGLYTDTTQRATVHAVADDAAVRTSTEPSTDLAAVDVAGAVASSLSSRPSRDGAADEQRQRHDERQSER